MDDWKLPDYAAAHGNLEGGADDDETLLAEHELEDEEDEKAGLSGSRRSMKSSVWMILMTMATLDGRRLLPGGFRESSVLLLPLDLMMRG